MPVNREHTPTECSWSGSCSEGLLAYMLLAGAPGAGSVLFGIGWASLGLSRPDRRNSEPAECSPSLSPQACSLG